MLPIIRTIFLIGFLAVYHGLLWADTDVTSTNNIILEATSFSYRDHDHIVEAEGNVVLIVNDIRIESEKIYLNTEENKAWTDHLVTIRVGDSFFTSNGLKMNLDTQEFSIFDSNVIIQSPDTSSHIYLKAMELHYTEHEQTGKSGWVTTCSLDDPHYHFQADHFTYSPNERIMGYNVWLDFPILGVPLGLWSPMYNYELGERKIVWNFPTIGEKQTPGWGYFMQNTIDYDLVDGEESSVYVDFYENKGVGWGARHRYKFDDNPGSIYFYTLTEQDNDDYNYRFSIDQSFKLSDHLDATFAYKNTDAERINTSGTEQREQRSFGLLYDKLGDRYEFNFSDDINRRNNINRFHIDFKRQFNGETPISFSFDNTENENANRRTIGSTLGFKQAVFEDSSLNTNLTYTSRSSIRSDGTAVDDHLRATTIFSHQFNPEWSMRLTLDHLFDLDDDRVTRDNLTDNNFFYKQPEVTFDYESTHFGYNIDQEITFARYQEVQFDSATQEQVIFPNNSDFGVVPNAYIFKTDVNRQWKHVFLNGNVNFSADFEQYNFLTPGFSFFESDAYYTWEIRPAYEVDFFGFVVWESAYERRFTPEEGNTPFLRAFNADQINENRFSQALKFYIDDVNKYAWNHSVKYDFERQRWEIYLTSLKIAPDEWLNFNIQTGMNINSLNTFLDDRISFRDANIFLPLVWDIYYEPVDQYNVRLYHSQNLNNGQLNYSTFTQGFILGGEKDYQWEFQLQWTYDTSRQLRTYHINQYDLDTFRLIKQDHCRTIAMSYNRRLDEYRFSVTIDAYPRDTIGIVRNRAITKFEGVLDDASQERF